MDQTESSDVKPPVKTAIEPWLSIAGCAKALAFYKSALGAEELYKLADPDGMVMVAKMAVEGAGFWLSEQDPEKANVKPDGSVRMILIVDDPDSLFAKALNAGATEIFPVGEEHGWRMGRLEDPFGHHWEIGHPIDA